MGGPVTKTKVSIPEKYGDIVNKLLTKQNLANVPVSDTSKLTLYCVRLAELVDIVRGSRPSSGTKRAAYDAAVRVLGKGTKYTAYDKLTTAHAEAFKALYALVQKGGEIGKYGVYLNKYFIKIIPNVLKGYDDYANYATAQTAIAGLKGKTLNLKLLLAAPAGKEKQYGGLYTERLTVSRRDIGPVRLITRKGEKGVDFVLGTPGTEAILMFGETQSNYPNATAFANAYLAALSAKDSTNKQDRVNAGTTLANALGNITNTNITSNQNFQDALALLRAGDIKGALEKLSGITTLGAAINSIDGRIHTVTVRNKAVTIAQGKVTARFVFRKNWERFKNDIAGGAKGWHQPRVLAVLVGMYYEYLALVGRYKELRLQGGQQTLVSSQRLKGTGHVVGATPQLVMGTVYNGNPLLFTFYVDFGYQQYKVGKNIETPTGPKWVGAKQKTAYLGAWGVQIDRLPPREGPAPVRIASLGVGSVGDAKNPFAYMVTEFNYPGRHAEKWDIKTELTTQYAYWLRSHQVKLGLVPAKMKFRVGKGVDLTISPEFVSNTIIGGKGELLGYEFTGSGALGLNIRRDRADVSIRLKGGYQYGRTIRGEQIASPSSPFVGLEIVITPRTRHLGTR